MSVDPVWRLPGPARFLEQLVDDLHDGCSILIAAARSCPPNLRVNLAERLHEEAWRRPVHRLVLGGDGSQTDPARQLLQAFGGLHATRGPVSTEDLLGSDGLAPGIYWAEGIDGAITGDVWSTFLRRFAVLAGSRPAEQRPCLIIPLAGDARDLAGLDDVTLRCRDWRDAVNALDLAMFALHRLPHSNTAGAAAAQELTAQLVAELACGDFGLADAMLACHIDAVLEPLPLLRSLAREHLGLNNKAARRVLNGGIVLPAAAALAGEHRVVERAVWRAQMRVLFPLLEERRTAIVEKRPAWLTLPHYRDAGPPIEDPFALEIGHLLQQLRRRHPRDPLIDELQSLAQIRNQLAHLRPCPPNWLRRPAIRGLINLDALGR